VFKNIGVAGFMHVIFALFEVYELDTLYPARVRFETFSMNRKETLSTL